MKIGLFYEDKNTGELFMCANFSYSIYSWINADGKIIMEDKTNAWAHINSSCCTNKTKIKWFLDNIKYEVKGLCCTCNKIHLSNFKRYTNERASGIELCPVCGDKLRY